MEKIREAVSFIKRQIDITPEIGLVLGSGLGEMARSLRNHQIIPYQDIPNFPVSTVKGHAGNLILGELEGRIVITQQGRFHFYEGYSMQEITLPIRVMKMLGIKTLLLTNAAGGVNTNYQAGDLMLIVDHINLMGDNPLRGKNYQELGPRFPDMSEPYDQQLIKLTSKLAELIGIVIQKGVYCGLSGPSYETAVEIKFLRNIGVDAVGMSTVPEVIVARHMGLRVLGISCITNMAAGVLPKPLDHQEVMTTAEKTKPLFISLIKLIMPELP